jgi:hypothetical protein
MRVHSGVSDFASIEMTTRITFDRETEVPNEQTFHIFTGQPHDFIIVVVVSDGRHTSMSDCC